LDADLHKGIVEPIAMMSEKNIFFMKKIRKFFNSALRKIFFPSVYPRDSKKNFLLLQEG
jgi:hypothetical protein